MDEFVGDTEVAPHRVRLGARIYALKKGRQGWKRRAQERGAKVKSQSIRIRDLEVSRHKWKDEARRMQQRIAELEAEAAELRERLGQSAEKKVPPGAR